MSAPLSWRPPGTTERTVATNGVELRVTEAGEGPLVILAHGFPELARSWRHQVPALAGAGYRVVAPDQRGYGGSSRPPAVDAYDIEHLTGDLLGLADEAGVERAVFVGHDWGSLVVWSLAQRYPERVAGVVGMSVPFLARPPQPPTQIFRQLFGQNFFYMLYFQEPGVADADLGRDPATTMRRFLAGLSASDGAALGDLLSLNDGRGMVERMPEPAGLPGWLTEEELAAYVDAFTRTGFTGGLNWYRNLDRNWELSADLAGKGIDVPSAFVAGSADPVIVMSPWQGMEQWLSDFRGATIVDGAGHWVQQERPEEVTAALLTFLGGLDLK